MDDLTGLLLWGGSPLTCIIKTNSPCLSSHDEGINAFQFQQATILQLHYYSSHNNVCCFTHMHTDISVFHARHCKKSSDAPITTKDNTLLNHFFIEVCAANKHFLKFLSSPLVLSRLTTAVIVFFCLAEAEIKYLIWGCITSILAPNITTRW